MTGLAIALAICLASSISMLGLVIRAHERERAAWQLERRELTNRIIARHTGEVVALDHSSVPRPDREPRQPVLVEGLS